MRILLWTVLILVSLSPVARAGKLPFLQDDFGKARVQATQRKLPIFVECWAPW